jgi:hypothetical protein
MSIQDINFEAVVEISAVESGPVYVYTVVTEGIHLRKKVANDFETWIVTCNHFENHTSMIVTGAPPTENASDYTLMHHVENFVKPSLPAETMPVEEQPE